MGKSMNPKMSGFRKWAEIHEPTKIDKVRRSRLFGQVPGRNNTGFRGFPDVVE